MPTFNNLSDLYFTNAINDIKKIYNVNMSFMNLKVTGSAPLNGMVLNNTIYLNPNMERFYNGDESFDDFLIKKLGYFIGLEMYKSSLNSIVRKVLNKSKDKSNSENEIFARFVSESLIHFKRGINDYGNS